jgi:glycerol uptake facilitator-like aquaporin
LYDLSFGQFFLVLVVSAAVSMAVFAHADKRGNKHATAWGIATFLALGVAVPLYFIRYWLRTRRGR